MTFIAPRNKIRTNIDNKIAYLPLPILFSMKFMKADFIDSFILFTGIFIIFYSNTSYIFILLEGIWNKKSKAAKKVVYTADATPYLR